jgi:hypothetical protein
MEEQGRELIVPVGIDVGLNPHKFTGHPFCRKGAAVYFGGYTFDDHPVSIR